MSRGISLLSPFRECFWPGTRARVRAAAPLAAVVGLLPGSPVGATGQSLARITSEIEVAADSTAALVEPHLAVSPNRASHLVGAAMAVRAPDLSVIDCLIVTSFDAGRSWSRHDLGLRQCADPWVTITRSGTALVSVLSDIGVSIYRSPDGGRTWPQTADRVDGAHDHPMTTQTRDGTSLYLVSGLAVRDSVRRNRSAVFVARSDDDGRTWRDVAAAVVSNLSYEAMTPAVSETGALMVPIQDHHRSSGTRLAVRRSWLLVLPTSAAAFEPPLLIDEGCNRRGPVGWPALVLARPPGAPERLLWACESEEGRGIRVRASRDHGETWADSAHLAAGGSAAWTKVPALAADEVGTVFATWFEGESSSSSTCLNLYGASASDTGASFSTPVRISTRPSCPHATDVSARFPAGGDYVGLVSPEPGLFRVLWSDARTGSFRLYMATVRSGR